MLKKREEAILKEDSKLIQEYNDAIFGQNKKYEGWMEELEIDYPSFYELKYDFPEVSIKELKKDLGRKETTLIEYFLGDKNLYIFIIDENGIHVDVQEINKAFHENITVVNNGLNQLDYSFESFTKYHQSAHALFNTLLGVSIKQKWIKNENLIIIRDEQLNLVPFEALISKPYVSKEEDVLYGRLDYLLNDYYISYLYSSNLIGNKSKYSKSKKFLGIAPSFENPNIQKLEYNQEEINRINAFYNDEVLKDKKATYASFMNKIQGRDIVHFATHAIFNDEIPLDSRIELADTSLYIYEIFSLPHDLQLAVLSACQTASGKSRKGEGIISLSRSFVQSGCPSVVASLWDVSDQRASDLLTYFHENLVKGNERKDVSLAEAKRKYLIESVSVNTHPFLWAGFIQIGDVSPIISSNNNFIYWLLGILFILLILFLIYRKMK